MYVEGPQCKLVAYTSANTTCSCSIPNSSPNGTLYNDYQQKLISSVKVSNYPMRTAFVPDLVSPQPSQNIGLVIFVSCFIAACMIAAVPLVGFTDRSKNYLDEPESRQIGRASCRERVYA
jgi:hypothetical protein